jgi:hypothetical protein
MAVQGLTIALTTSPTAIANVPGGPGFGSLRVIVRNRGAANVYLGSSGVTTSGYQLSTGDIPLQITLQPWDALYGTSTGSIVVDVLRMNETT